jgi:maleylacetate reductase
MSLPQSFVHDVPASRVVFGVGAVEQVLPEVSRLGGQRVMLIAGGPEAALCSSIDVQLGERIVTRFADVTMHVPIEVAQAAVRQALAAEVDLLLSLGGGSSTGTAKAVALETGLPILAVPTTYAGSEMTSIWGLTENQRKTTGRDLRVLPRTVVYDPVLTLGLPVDISAASGMNAMAHLVEALYAPGISPVSFMQAKEGVRALAFALPRVVADPMDLYARAEALYGAWLAGWALGTTGMGVHHKICHVLGGAYNLPHAPMHSAVLPYATAYNARAAPDAMAAVVQALHEADQSADTAAGGLFDLQQRIGAPTSLVEVGFDPDQIASAASLVVAGAPTNPRQVDQSGIEGLLSNAVAGGRPQ